MNTGAPTVNRGEIVVCTPGFSATRRLALNNRGLLNTTCQQHTRCTLNWVRQGGREGAMKDGGWEGGNKGRVGREGVRGWSEEAMM